MAIDPEHAAFFMEFVENKVVNTLAADTSSAALPAGC
jgi:hypothetical protein